jgi:Flp pilus assembly protein TadD
MKLMFIINLLFLILSCSSQKTATENQVTETAPENKIERLNLTDLENECKNQDLTNALKNLSSQYTIYKSEPEYWNLIGSCFLNDMKPLKARLFFLRALEEEKTFAPALNNLGVVYWQMEKHYEALAYFKRAEQLDRSSVAVKYNLARLYSWYGLHKSSNEKFSQVPTDSLNTQDYNFIATNQAMLGQFDNAVKSFKTTKQLNSKFQAVYAYALKKVGQHDDAASEWNQAKVSERDALKWLWILGEEK